MHPVTGCRFDRECLHRRPWPAIVDPAAKSGSREPRRRTAVKPRGAESRRVELLVAVDVSIVRRPTLLALDNESQAAVAESIAAGARGVIATTLDPLAELAFAFDVIMPSCSFAEMRPA
jgi:hypothetical protein